MLKGIWKNLADSSSVKINIGAEVTNVFCLSLALLMVLRPSRLSLGADLQQGSRVQHSYSVIGTCNQELGCGLQKKDLLTAADQAGPGSLKSDLDQAV